MGSLDLAENLNRLEKKNKESRVYNIKEKIKEMIFLIFLDNFRNFKFFI